MPLYHITYRRPGSRALWRTFVETDSPQVLRDRLAGLDLVSIRPPLPPELEPSPAAATPPRAEPPCASPVSAPAARPSAATRRPKQGRGIAPTRAMQARAEAVLWRRCASLYLAGRLQPGQIITKRRLGDLMGQRDGSLWDLESLQFDLAIHRAPLRLVTDSRSVLPGGSGHAETHVLVRAA